MNIQLIKDKIAENKYSYDSVGGLIIDWLKKNDAENDLLKKTKDEKLLKRNIGEKLRKLLFNDETLWWEKRVKVLNGLNAVLEISESEDNLYNLKYFNNYINFSTDKIPEISLLFSEKFIEFIKTNETCYFIEIPKGFDTYFLASYIASKIDIANIFELDSFTDIKNNINKDKYTVFIKNNKKDSSPNHTKHSIDALKNEKIILFYENLDEQLKNGFENLTDKIIKNDFIPTEKLKYNYKPEFGENYIKQITEFYHKKLRLKISLEKINYYMKNIGINVTFKDIELILFLFNTFEINNIDNIYICENGKDDESISYLRKIVWESITENKKIQIQGNEKIIDTLLIFEFVKKYNKNINLVKIFVKNFVKTEDNNENFVKLNYDNFLVKEIILFYLNDWFNNKSFSFIGKILFFESSAEVVEDYLININEDKYKNIVSNFLSMYDNQNIQHIAVLEMLFYTIGNRILIKNDIDNSFEDYKKIIYHQLDCLIEYNKDNYYGQLTINGYRNSPFDFIIICWAINYSFRDLNVDEKLKYQFPLNFENNDIKNANYSYSLKIDKITNQIIEYIVKESFINATCEKGLISFELAIINNDFSKITEINDFFRYFEKKYNYLSENIKINLYQYFKDKFFEKKLESHIINKSHLKEIIKTASFEDFEKIDFFEKNDFNYYKDIIPKEIVTSYFIKEMLSNLTLLQNYFSKAEREQKFEIFKEAIKRYKNDNYDIGHLIFDYPSDCVDFITSSDFSDIEDFLIDFVFLWILDEFTDLLKYIEKNIKNIKRKSDLAAKLKRRLPNSGEYATNIFNVIQKLEK